MTLTLLKTLLIIITFLMFLLRFLAYGWFLFLFGIGFILVTGFHLYSGWTFLNTMSFPDPEGMDLLLFFGMNFVYIVFYLVQIDFNDAPDSTVSVLEKVIGKNKFTTYLIESQFNLMIYLLFPLLALDITVLILALRR
ncbi:MAG: hypothetical protein KBF99_02515 [Leptospiraceae bacterium]|nr:hypothetical protein [Leptospiraceae bacterium]MBK9498133.1 hypothetical protein [Leptospiraceae bacterium]MBL0266732.1 hypothetical protein [Leptospiraceae bacterium]MBP9162020.1 hypothetical protein [Leptospiraceae bacterium]